MTIRPTIAIALALLPGAIAHADDADVDGFAAGLWASSISGRSYPGGAMELDLCASYGREATSGHPWPHFQQEQ